jgi:D-alanyl-D-alanine carboxypeptidase
VTTIPAPLARRLNGLLRQLAARRDVPHAVLAVAAADGAWTWSGAAGAAQPDGTPMRADTPFFIASIDKLFTATLVLKLHERGRVRLHAPISTYLSSELIDGLHRLRGIDRTGEVTLRHLLSHTSGLADWLEDIPRGGTSLVERLLADGDRGFSRGQILRHVRDRLQPHFAPQPLEAPRPRVRYSDTNFVLLQAIVEAVTTVPLHHVLDEFVLAPLGLQHTWVAGASAPRAPAAAPASLWAGARALPLQLLLRSLQGMYSTTHDLLTFLRALVRGALFDDPATAALMQQRWHRFGLPLDRAARRLPPWPIEYGLGMMRLRDPVVAWLERLPWRPLYLPPAVVGHTGSTGAWLWHCPRLDVLLAGSVDQVTAGALPFRLLPKLLRAVEEQRPRTA